MNFIFILLLCINFLLVFCEIELPTICTNNMAITNGTEWSFNGDTAPMTTNYDINGFPERTTYIIGKFCSIECYECHYTYSYSLPLEYEEGKFCGNFASVRSCLANPRLPSSIVIEVFNGNIGGTLTSAGAIDVACYPRAPTPVPSAAPSRAPSPRPPPPPSLSPVASPTPRATLPPTRIVDEPSKTDSSDNSLLSSQYFVVIIVTIGVVLLLLALLCIFLLLRRRRGGDDAKDSSRLRRSSHNRRSRSSTRGSYQHQQQRSRTNTNTRRSYNNNNNMIQSNDITANNNVNSNMHYQPATSLLQSTSTTYARAMPQQSPPPLNYALASPMYVKYPANSMQEQVYSPPSVGSNASNDTVSSTESYSTMPTTASMLRIQF